MSHFPTNPHKTLSVLSPPLLTASVVTAASQKFSDATVGEFFQMEGIGETESGAAGLMSGVLIDG